MDSVYVCMCVSVYVASASLRDPLYNDKSIGNRNNQVSETRRIYQVNYVPENADTLKTREKEN